MAPGLQSFALYSGLAMARGQGSRIFDEDGNSYIDFIAGIAVGSVGHCHPHYVKALQEQAARLTFGSFTTEVRAKFLDLLGGVDAAGPDAHPALLRRRRSGRGGLPAGQVRDEEARVRRLLGRLPRQDRRRAAASLGRFQARPRAPSCRACTRRPTPYCYRCPLNLTYPDCGIACAEETRDVIQNQTRRRDRRDHRRADAGHGRQRHPSAGVPPGRAGDREGPRRALHRRRDDHGLRPHRQVLGRRPRRRRRRTS